MSDFGAKRRRRVRASVPTSTANIGLGFDVFSVALERPRIDVEFEPAPSGTRKIVVQGEYAAKVNIDPHMHPAGKALFALAAESGEPGGYVLRISSDLSPGKGLGVSGAVAVGAVFCANQSLGLRLDGLSLVNIAAKAEPEHHMDNACASAFGGFNIVARTPMEGSGAITVIPPPKDLGLAILVPDIENLLRRKPAN